MTTSVTYITIITLFSFTSSTLYLGKRGGFDSIALLALSGLPPFPTFFLKLWLLSYLSIKTLGFIILTMLILNSTLLYAYLSFIIIGRQVTYIKNSRKPNDVFCKTIDVAFFTVVFIVTPNLFRVI